MILFYILAFLFTSVSIGAAHNPFTSKPGESHKTLKSPIKSKLFVKIIFWQHQLREKMSQLIREAKSQKRVAPIFLLALFAFFYGAIHSTGPGHGKAVALSYILSCKPSLPQSLAFGNLVAMTHGFSGIFLVLSVKFILMTSISRSLETMTYITQIISFSLICLMGLIIFIKSLLSCLNRPPDDVQKQTWLFTTPFTTAFVIGLIPCPGVVMVMLFAISLNLTWLGIFLGAMIAAGMASTITLTVLIGMSGKVAALKLISHNSRLRNIIKNSIETLAGLLVASLGFILLLANI